MFGKLIRIATFAVSLSAAGASSAVNLITNGGFETGNFTGWTTDSLGGTSCAAPWTVATSGTTATCNNPGTPHSGTYAAYSPFDGAGPVVRYLRQSVNVPSDVGEAVLKWSQAAVVDLRGAAVVAINPRVLNVNILDSSANKLATVYTQSFPGGALTTVPWTDITQYVTQVLAPKAGQSVIVEFSLTIPDNFTGPAGIAIDDVSLDVTPAERIPTMSQAGLALLITLMGATALVVVRRRRPGAKV